APREHSNLCAPLSPMQWNDLYCLSRPQVHTLSVGASRPEDFAEHIAALEHYDRAAEIAAPITARLESEIARALGSDWLQRGMTSLPNYEKIPGEVNVQEIVRLWTYAKSLDLVDWGKMRYNLLNGAGGHWFPGRNAAIFDSKAIRSALHGHPIADKLPDILTEAHALLVDQPKKRLSQGG